MASDVETTPPAPAEAAGLALVTRAALHRLIDDLPEANLPEARRRLDDLATVADDAQETALVERWIRHDPARGPHRAVVAGTGVPVYALIGELTVFGDEADPVGRVADGFQVAREAVEAALAHYRRHRFLIDAWMALNAL